MKVEKEDILSSRVFSCSREKLFDAWTDPKLLERWWGPNGFTNTFELCEIRPGGRWIFTMHGPDGKNYPNESVFLEVVRPALIVFDHLRPMHQFHTRVTLSALGGGETQLDYHMRFGSIEECERVKNYIVRANEEIFDRLEAVLLTMP